MASDGILVKLVVDEPEVETHIFEFEQDTIKIGRGRVGKARKGVDVQLTDPTVARVASVIQVRKEDDVFVMDMGSDVTRIAGKKVGARGKLSSGTEMLVGNTKITVYIGEDALNFSLDATPEVAVESEAQHVDSSAEYSAVDDFSILSEESLSHESTESLAAGDATGPQPAFSPGVSEVGEDTSTQAVPDTQAYNGNTGEHAGYTPSDLSATGTAVPGFPQGYQLYPMHQTPSSVFGPLGPTPPPLPEHFSGPNLHVLLDVADRLGKEVWYVQNPIW